MLSQLRAERRRSSPISSEREFSSKDESAETADLNNDSGEIKEERPLKAPQPEITSLCGHYPQMNDCLLLGGGVNRGR